MANASLQIVYRAVITAKLTYAASAWWGRGFTTEADRQRLGAIIRRGKRTDLCSEDHPALAELVECADDELFDKVLINSGHVLYSILPRETFIHSFFISGTWPIESRTDRYIQKIDYTHTHIKSKT